MLERGFMGWEGRRRALQLAPVTDTRESATDSLSRLRATVYS